MNIKSDNLMQRLFQSITTLLLLFVLSAVTLSCSDSDSPAKQGDVIDDGGDSGGEQQEPNDDDPVLKVYTETGQTGMRVTYSPASLTALTDVEQLEAVYAELMSCVGLSAVTPPALLLTDDESLFYVREDGTDVWGYYDAETANVRVYADDLGDEGNQYWWTRHGMILYLIAEHGLDPDSNVSPFLHCHWPADG